MLVFVAPRAASRWYVAFTAEAEYRHCSAISRDGPAAVALHQKPTTRLALHPCGITPRSTTGPTTAGRLGPAWGTRYIFPARAKPSRRSRPVSSTLGLAGKLMWNASRISACRRGLNSHETARPRPAEAEPSGAALKTWQDFALVGIENQDAALLGLTASVSCEQDRGLQSVCRAAAATTEVHRHAVARRLQIPAWHCPSAQRRCRCLPSLSKAGSRAFMRARPNTSLNHRTRYGGLSWPGLR